MTTATAPSIPAAEPSALVPTFVGRQPIFDKNLDIRAYEILYRGGLDNRADFANSDWATGQSFWNAFVEFGLDRIAPTERAHLNVTRAFVISDVVRLLPPEKIALEIPCTETVDDAYRAALDVLLSEGYRLVLDGFDDGPEARSLLDIASSVKIAVGDIGGEAAKTALAAKERGVVCVAKTIETFDQFEECRRAGFQGFQGHFLSKPQIVAGARIPADSLTRTRLLAAINDPRTSIEDLVEVISQDVAITYKLLAYLNSALFALASDIRSIQHAVMILGDRWVRTWANLVILAGVSDKPQAAFGTAVVRAKMCERLGVALGAESPESFFTCGLLSSLDFLLDRPMDEILADLPLTNELKDALIRYEGPCGDALACALQYERSEWEDVRCGDLTGPAIRDAYLAAVRWAADVRGVVAA